MKIERELTKVTITKEEEKAFDKAGQLIFDLCQGVNTHYDDCYDCPFCGICAISDKSVKTRLEDFVDEKDTIIQIGD